MSAGDSWESKVFRALASPTRLAVLRSLEKQPLNYTELLQATGLDRKTGSGKFAHHIRILLSAGLVGLDEKTRKYSLTAKGVRVVQSLGVIHSAIAEAERIKVRKSGLFMEQFDRNRIAQVLVEEAGVPPKVADKLAKLAEEKLEALKIQYLTAPLIRELVNVLLIDQGLEEYRHRLSRLGMPVYDVEKLLRKAAERRDFHALVKETSRAVFKEYMLHTALPRTSVDKHLSGDIDLTGFETWAFSIHAKLYTSNPERALHEADAIEDEVVFTAEALEDSRLAENLYHVLSCKGLGVSIYCDDGVRDYGGAAVITSQRPSHGLHGRVEVIVSHRPATAGGHPFSASGVVDGAAAINLAGIFLGAGGYEKRFWDGVRSAVDSMFKAFSRKAEMVSRFWEGVGGHFIVSMVGVSELVRSGFSLFELVESVWRECRDVSTSDVRLHLSGCSPEKVAARLYALDVNRYGAKSVGELAGGGVYSHTLPIQDLRQVPKLARILPGGLKLGVDAGELAYLVDLQPLLVLPPATQR
jgi:DNA-binding transcriptional ArsR family regulator